MALTVVLDIDAETVAQASVATMLDGPFCGSVPAFVPKPARYLIWGRMVDIERVRYKRSQIRGRRYYGTEFQGIEK